jgi:hypothetical protein
MPFSCKRLEHLRIGVSERGLSSIIMDTKGQLYLYPGVVTRTEGIRTECGSPYNTTCFIVNVM